MPKEIKCPKILGHFIAAWTERMKEGQRNCIPEKVNSHNRQKDRNIACRENLKDNFVIEYNVNISFTRDKHSTNKRAVLSVCEFP
jgi:hypothetical protein